ncbi:MAG TPA: hypothetical protein VGH33_19355 [Isosphaeraceae bacterium]
MSTPATGDRRRWRIHLGVFLLLPVISAIAFAWLANWYRVPIEDRMEQEHKWTLSPNSTKFWPEDGARVRWGDPVLKVASVRAWPNSLAYLRVGTWLVDDRGIVREQSHIRIDAGSDEYPLRAEASAALSALLAKLPPSDPAASPPTDILYVAHPHRGRWLVRTYRASAAPKEASDVLNVVAARPTSGGK